MFLLDGFSTRGGGFRFYFFTWMIISRLEWWYVIDLLDMRKKWMFEWVVDPYFSMRLEKNGL